MSAPGVQVDITLETVEPLPADVVALVMADAAQLMQTVRRHTPPSRPTSAHPPAYTRLPEAFDGKRG